MQMRDVQMPIPFVILSVAKNLICYVNHKFVRFLLVTRSKCNLLKISNCHSEHSEESQNCALTARQILRYAQNDKWE